MANSIRFARAVHNVFTLYYKFVGKDQGHCVMLNAVDEFDAERQARRYHIRQRVLADAAIYDSTGEIVADAEDLRYTRAMS